MRDLLSKLDEIIAEGEVEKANFPGAPDVKMSGRQRGARMRYRRLHQHLQWLANSGAINTPKGKESASKIIDAIQQLVDTELPGNSVPSKKIWLEGYRITRDFDRERYQERAGLEGPFSAKNGKVVYYDPKEGKYYDPDTDMYIDYDDWQAMNEQEVGEGDEPDEQYLDKVISDLHKDAYGMRPDHEFGREWMSSSYEGKLEIYKNMLKNLHSDMGENVEENSESIFQIGDDFGISFTEDFEIATEISDILEDGILIDLDEHAIAMLQKEGITFVDVDLNEEKKKDEAGQSCWKGYRKVGTKPGTGRNKGKRVNDCEKIGEETELEEKSYPFAGRAVGHKEGPAGQWRNKGPKANKPARTGDLVGGVESVEHDVDEAKYQGREVPLGKPMAGDVKKSKVYVRGPKGNVVKVNFGDKKMKIKKSNPKRRKSFRARHNCANPGPRWKARYWSCRAW